MDLVEIDKSNQYSIYPVPFGKVSDIGKIVVKKAVSWKGVKGESYKTTYREQYENQQKEARRVREKALSEANTKYAGKPVALVTYGNGEYGIIPTVSALMAMNMVSAKHKSKGISIVGAFPTKEAAIARLKAESIQAYEELISH